MKITLECHPYPECKPTHRGDYLVQYTRPSPYSDIVAVVEWQRAGWELADDYVIAWAEMPESLTDDL